MAEGFEVVVPKGQGCCGALSWHAGRKSEAARLAKQTVDVFKSAGVEHVVVNAAGCGSAMKEYAMLLAGDPDYEDAAAWLAGHTLDFSELLAPVEPRAKRQPVNMRVAYHDACHLAHAAGHSCPASGAAPSGTGSPAVRDPDEFCCGSAGIYNLVQPEAARELGERKAAAILATGAECVVSTNPGCLMQVKSGLKRSGSVIETAHLAEILDTSISGRRPANG